MHFNIKPLLNPTSFPGSLFFPSFTLSLLLQGKGRSETGNEVVLHLQIKIELVDSTFADKRKQ